MNYLKKFFGHLKTVCVHKWWVFYYCWHFGIPFRGLVHDMSKFSPTEFFESVKYYDGTVSPIEVCKSKKGFSSAWMHHKGRNKHHYEYWQDNFDNGGESLIMPFKYSLEMLCDYLGAGRAYMGKNFSFNAELMWWYGKCEKPIAIHTVNQEFITKMLIRLRDEPHPEVWRTSSHWNDIAKTMYNDIWENYILELCNAEDEFSNRDYGDSFIESLDNIEES